VDTALLDHLDEAFTLVINGLKKCFGSKPEPRKEDVSLDPVMIRNLIKQLRESLEDYDSHAVSLMEELKASLADSMISREIRVLQSHLDAYDFESALKALEHVEKALDPHLKNGRGLSTRHEPKDAE
jgi:ribosomal protein S20